MQRSRADLSDEIADICVIEIHVFVYIGKVERRSCRRRSWRVGAPEDVAEGEEEMRKDTTTANLSALICVGRSKYHTTGLLCSKRKQRW